MYVIKSYVTQKNYADVSQPCRNIWRVKSKKSEKVECSILRSQQSLSEMGSSQGRKESRTYESKHHDEVDVWVEETCEGYMLLNTNENNTNETHSKTQSEVSCAFVFQ